MEIYKSKWTIWGDGPFLFGMYTTETWIRENIFKGFNSICYRKLKGVLELG